MALGILFFCAVMPTQALGSVPIPIPNVKQDSFCVEIGRQIYNWDVLAQFVMPGESLPIRIIPKENTGSYGWICSGGSLLSVNPLEQIWVAPQEAGLYPVIIKNHSIKTINIFVMVQFQNLQKGKLNNYPIGWYPKSSPHPKLSTPKGFIQVTADIESTRLSPSFILKEFICRQPGDFPKYLVLKEELIIKLEFLQAKIREKGYPCSKLFVFSGYRTPRYNTGGGAGRQSAHIYGGAADFFIDEDHDSVIDDLNNDGRHNAKDSKILFDIDNELDAERPDLVGGLGWYRRVTGVGPCIHVDIRGKPTRWRQ
jgi:hypothetical protein